MLTATAVAPAYDDLGVNAAAAPSARRKRKLPLVIIAVGALVLAAVALLLFVKPFSNDPPRLRGIEASQLMVQSGDSVKLAAAATDPNGDQLTYEWRASAGQLIGDGSEVTLTTAGVDAAAAGRADVSVRVTVSDGRGGTVSTDKTITVTPAPAGPGPAGPGTGALAVTIEADSRSVRVGESVKLTANISNRDPNQVTYEWKTSAGAIQANGRTASLGTSGIQAGGNARQVSVTVTVKDASGATALDNATISVASVAPSNWPPTITVKATHTSVQQGEDVEIVANASDRDGDALTYSWSISGGQLLGSGNRVTLKTSASAPGPVMITATVSDGRGESATGKVTVAVTPRANHSPAVASIEADRTRVRAGERVSLSARASDPDGDDLRYSWNSSAGMIRGSGSTVTLDTSGIEPASSPVQVRITATASDGRGGVATESTSITVLPKPEPPPQKPRPAALSAYEAKDGDDLIVTLTGSPGTSNASSGTIEVTAGASGSAQVSGAWPAGACRVNAGSQQNIGKISFVQTPVPSNRYATIIVRVSPKNSKQPVRFTISWRAL